MIDLHYWPTPNGHKITLFLEEAKLPYKLIGVNIGTGEQFKPEFLKLSPNNRMPAIVALRGRCEERLGRLLGDFWFAPAGKVLEALPITKVDTMGSLAEAA